MRTFRSSFLVLFALATLTACSSDGVSGLSEPSHIDLSLLGPAPVVGDTIRVAASVTDDRGRPVPSATVSWSSANPSILTVSSSGLVTALAAGGTTIRATAGPALADLFVQVAPAIPASIVFTPDTATVFAPAGTTQLRPLVKDASGRTLNNPPLVWRSTATRIATVDAQGRVTAVAAGDVQIIASYTGSSGPAVLGTARLAVRVRESATAPKITAVAPSPIVAGSTVTITGTNFATTANANTVLVDGVAASVTAATATQLTVKLPDNGFLCESDRPVGVQVTVGSEAGAATATLRAAAPRTLAIGEHVVLDQATTAMCTAWAGGSRYLLSVVNTGPYLTGPKAGFTLRGVPASQGSAIMAGAPMAGDAPVVAASRPARPALQAAIAALSPLRGQPTALMPARGGARDDRTHAAIMEAQGAFLRTHRTPVPAVRRPAAATALPLESYTDVGALSTWRIPDLNTTNSCTTYTTITARTVYVGSKVVVLEDNATKFGNRPTMAGQIDSLLRQMGQEFETVSIPMLTTYFGDLFAMDRRLQNRGRVVLLFSPQVNGMRNGVVGAFVVACDQYLRTEQPSSNEGAFMYAQVPLGAGDGKPADVPGDWHRFNRVTLAHEGKHIISLAERRARDLPFEQRFLEEGMARIAEELYLRPIYGTTWKGGTTYRQSAYCEIYGGQPDVPACYGKPYGITKHLAENNYSWQQNELYAPLAMVDLLDSFWYSTTWAVIRWLVDQAPDEAAFLRGLTLSGDLGVANLEARSGKPWERILGESSLAFVLAGRSPLAGTAAALRFPSWNLKDQYQNLCDEFGPCKNPLNPLTQFPKAYPITPRTATLGRFSVVVDPISVSAYSAIELSGTSTTPQLLELTGLNGAALPASLRLALVRIQ